MQSKCNVECRFCICNIVLEILCFIAPKPSVRFKATKMETRKITSNTATATVNQVTKDGKKISFLIQNIRSTAFSIDGIGFKEYGNVF